MCGHMVKICGVLQTNVSLKEWEVEQHWFVGIQCTPGRLKTVNIIEIMIL